MRKFKKVLASTIAAATMAGCVGSMSASAYSNDDNWALRHVVGAPSSVQCFSDTYADVADTLLTSAYESCTVARFCIDEGGQTSRARYRGYYEYWSNGQKYAAVTFTHRYHTIYTGGGTIEYIQNVPAGCAYFIEFELQYYDPGNCSYSGNVKY